MQIKKIKSSTKMLPSAFEQQQCRRQCGETATAAITSVIENPK
jgi:hypothetical protein